MTEVALPTPVPMMVGNPIIKDELKPRSSTQTLQFDPEKHLAYTTAPKTFSMEEFGVISEKAISPVAISEPFPLFTEESVQTMRSEIFTKEVWDNCRWSTEFAHCQIRDYCDKYVFLGTILAFGALTVACRYAPFTYDAWKHPRTLEIISRIAGVDLIPAIDLEISNVNIATQGFDDGEAKTEANSDLPATKWHYDSYPFVCVVMLSDTTNMIGGETAIRKPSGEVIRVRGPQRVRPYWWFLMHG
jgi:hypothetical protein